MGDDLPTGYPPVNGYDSTFIDFKVSKESLRACAFQKLKSDTINL